MSEERFFNHVREQFQAYSPEVPQAVYSGMRRKLWWSEFTSFKAFRFNMWYLLLLLGASGAGAYLYQSQEYVTASAASNATFETAPVMVISNDCQPSLCSSESAHSGCCSAMKTTAAGELHYNSELPASGTSISTLSVSNPSLDENADKSVVNTNSEDPSLMATSKTADPMVVEQPIVEPAPAIPSKPKKKISVPLYENSKKK